MIGWCVRGTVMAVLVFAAPLEGQQPGATGAGAPATHSRLVLEGAGAAVAVFATAALLDAHVAHETQKLRDVSSPGMQHASFLTSSIGGVGPLAVSVTLAAAGSLGAGRGMRSLGIDATRAVILSGGLTALAKGLVGRARPSAFTNDADEFLPGHGFVDNRWAAFPSGHTSAAFAAATVFAEELGRQHVHHRTLLRATFYGAATLIGLSRMYENAHWSSDVLAGAALGMASGLRVARRAAPAIGR